MPGIPHKGVNYCAGVTYAGDVNARDVWRSDLVEREIKAIREELHCTSISVYGTDVSRLVECAEIALREGLYVWLQPRMLDGTPEEALDHLAEAAKAAEVLRREHGDVILNVGCEASLYIDGIVPGDDFAVKGFPLDSPRWWPMLPLFNKRLNILLARMASVARKDFHGRITYGAGLWETVDWTPFDIVGLNYYRHEHNKEHYRTELRRQHRHGKPVAVMEFGCGSYEEADEHGPRAHGLVDRHAEGGPVLAHVPKRDEGVQARYVSELIRMYAAEGVFGAFAFEFIQPGNPHTPHDPRHDLDMVGYTVTKVTGHTNDLYSWEPKQAYHEIARLYREI